MQSHSFRLGVVVLATVNGLSCIHHPIQRVSPNQESAAPALFPAPRPSVVTPLARPVQPRSPGPRFCVSKTARFEPQGKNVLLLKDPDRSRQLIAFRTALRVNTDGSPLSYHPQDPRGETLAINTVCNAISVRKIGSRANLCRSRFGKAIQVFESWRDSGYRTVPKNYRISWTNVLASRRVKGRDLPCVFQTGPYQGYFGSLTALQNGIAGDSSECGVDNQVSSLTAPSFVLPGGENPLKEFGAGLGDLLIAYNPSNGLSVAAIIGDVGPADNLGEGSVALNMQLLGVPGLPTNRREAYGLSIAEPGALIVILPGSRAFELERPHTRESINRRWSSCLREAGFETPEELIGVVKTLPFEPGQP